VQCPASDADESRPPSEDVMVIDVDELEASQSAYVDADDGADADVEEDEVVVGFDAIDQLASDDAVEGRESEVEGDGESDVESEDDGHSDGGGEGMTGVSGDNGDIYLGHGADDEDFDVPMGAPPPPRDLPSDSYDESPMVVSAAADAVDFVVDLPQRQQPPLPPPRTTAVLTRPPPLPRTTAVLTQRVRSAAAPPDAALSDEGGDAAHATSQMSMSSPMPTAEALGSARLNLPPLTVMSSSNGSPVVGASSPESAPSPQQHDEQLLRQHYQHQRLVNASSPLSASTSPGPQRPGSTPGSTPRRASGGGGGIGGSGGGRPKTLSPTLSMIRKTDKLRMATALTQTKQNKTTVCRLKWLWFHVTLKGNLLLLRRLSSAADRASEGQVRCCLHVVVVVVVGGGGAARVRAF
jgi:hypothetical protein